MKNLLPFILFVLLTSAGVYAQSKKEPIDLTKETVFTLVENPPKFKGGTEAMYAFIKKNIQYPKEARDAGIEGKVYLKFIVDAKGNVRNAQIMKGPDKLLNEEALRVINAMPKLIPGTQNGKNVNVYFNIPLDFKLN